MSRILSLLYASSALLSLSACASNPSPHRYVEVKVPCCCADQHDCDSVQDRCHTLRPDDLDDFGPRTGQPRIVRCEQWQSLDRYAERCPD